MQGTSDVAISLDESISSYCVTPLVRLGCKQDNGLFDTQVQSGKASNFYLPFSIV